jgi:hypothetical protein
MILEGYTGCNAIDTVMLTMMLIVGKFVHEKRRQQECKRHADRQPYSFNREGQLVV